jgi:hypothetical protein
MQVKGVGEGKIVEGFKDILRVKIFYFIYYFFNVRRPAITQREMLYFTFFSSKIGS